MQCAFRGAAEFLRRREGTCYLNRDFWPQAEGRNSHRAKQAPSALQPRQITNPSRASHRIVPYGNLLTGNLVTLTLKSAHA